MGEDRDMRLFLFHLFGKCMQRERERERERDRDRDRDRDSDSDRETERLSFSGTLHEVGGKGND